MNEEVLIEKGIVTNASQDEVEIMLIETNNCETCTTKDFCKGERTKVIVLKNKTNLKVGDKVKIEIRGKTIFYTVFMLYGIPLLILVLAFLVFYQIIEHNKELIVSSISFLAIGMYYFILNFYLRKIEGQFNVKVIKEV
jgi:positive regulator of sigma E activity